MLDYDPEIIRRVVEACHLIPRNDSTIVFKIKLIKTAGGVLLPDKQDSKASQGFATAGVVIAAGPGRFIDLTGCREPMDLDPGDIVLFAALAGLQLGEVIRKELGPDFSYEELCLIRAHDLLFKVRDRNVLTRSNEA